MYYPVCPPIFVLIRGKVNTDGELKRHSVYSTIKSILGTLRKKAIKSHF